MARTARIVVPGIPHHVTQRGNRRQQTFFGEADYSRYVDLVGERCRAVGVDILAWCLMPNHVHLLLVPSVASALTEALSSAHQRYSWLVNRRQGWQGHLWQSRFYSCPLDDLHLLAAVRYVELNPLRARLVASPEQWRWSSVRGHVSGEGDRLVRAARPRALQDIDDWLAFLAAGLTDEEIASLRLHFRTGKALGNPSFIAQLEAQTGLDLRIRPRGRPPKWGQPLFRGTLLSASESH